MRFRITFLIVTAFFVTMNVLLWRSEYGSRGHQGSPLPSELVWEKVLTSPDNSYLEIRHRGVKVGRAHWAATVAEAAATGQLMDDMPPEGMVKTPTGYRIDFDGSISLDDLSRLRFTCQLELDTNHHWQSFSIKVILKPYSWEVLADAATQSLKFINDDGERQTGRTFSASDLHNPQKLARELGGATLPVTLAALGIPLQLPPGMTDGVGLKWEAANDRLKIGHNLVRVFRLEARLFERYKAVLFVSPVGELLRVELPDDIILANDALLNL